MTELNEIKTRGSSSEPPSSANLFVRYLLWLAGLFAPGAIAKQLSFWFVSPRRLSVKPEHKETLGTGKLLRIPYSQMWLATWSWGAGPTVLLLHGWDDRGSRLATFVKPLLDTDYRVVMMDAPAHGDSGGRRGHVVEYAGAILGVVGAYGPPHAIIAHSYGAHALELAVLHGLHAERTILLAPVRNLCRFFDRFARYFRLSASVQRRMRDCLDRELGWDWQSTFTGEAIGKSGTTSLVIYGEEDSLVPPSEAHAIAAAANAKLDVFKGRGHKSLLDDESVIASVVSFLTQKPVTPVRTNCGAELNPTNGEGSFRRSH